MSRIVVYTAVFGGYDELRVPVDQTVDATWLCITDGPAGSVGPWERVVADVPFQDPRLRARYAKTHPLELLPPHDWSIWIDANVVVHAPTFVAEAVTLARTASADILTMPHATRDSVYEEALACAARGKGEPAVLERQIRRYREEGLPERSGLFETCMVVRPGGGQTRELGRAWFAECLRDSHRDQLALPYVAWKEGFVIAVTSFAASEPVSLSNRLTLWAQRRGVLERLGRRVLREWMVHPRLGALLRSPSRTAQRNPWFEKQPHGAAASKVP